jgi:hypothetical protein
MGKYQGDIALLLIIGGPGRTGKGILSRRLMVEMQQPYLSLDVVKMGLTNGVPAYGMDPDDGTGPVAEKLWPLVRAMAVNMLETDVHYIIEGEILPHHAVELAERFPEMVRACFLGYADVEADQKLREIREFAGSPNDWTVGAPDDDVLDVIVDSIQFSRELRDQCALLQIPYFDTSHEFFPTLDMAAAYLRTGVI